MAESFTLSSGTGITSPFDWGGARLQLSELDVVEKKLFSTQLEGLVGTDDSVVRAIFRDRKDIIEAAIMSIKQSLNDPTYEGIYPSDTGLGISLIRPMHVGDTSATPDGKTSWSETITAGNTRQAWIGASAADPFIVGGYSGDLSAGWGGLVLIGVESLSLTQVINEVKFWNDREERVPVNIEDMLLGDNTNQVPVFPISTEIYQPKSSMWAQLNGITTGATEYFKLIGLAVCLGKLLKRQTFA